MARFGASFVCIVIVIFLTSLFVLAIFQEKFKPCKKGALIWKKIIKKMQ